MTVDILTLLIFGGSLLTLACFYFAARGAWGGHAMAGRIARAQGKHVAPVAATQSNQIKRSGPQGRFPLLDALMQRLPNIATLQARLERTGRAISIGNYALANVLLGVAVAGLLMLLTRAAPLLAGLVGVTVGLGLPHFVVGFLIKRRMKKFLLLFPDALELIVRGLRSGLPVAESIHVVSHEISDPVGGVFREIGDAITLGVPLEKALADVAARMDLTEFNFFVTSITLQRETGGNLAEILANLAVTLRQRVMMRLKIKAMASQAKASAMIVGSLPIFIVLALLAFSPGYLNPFVDDFRGNVAALIGVSMFSFGIYVMIKMTNFEI